MPQSVLHSFEKFFMPPTQKKIIIGWSIFWEIFNQNVETSWDELCQAQFQLFSWKGFTICLDLIIFQQGYLSLRLSSCDIIFLWGSLHEMSSSREVVFLQEYLSVRFSFCEVVFLWGCLSVRLSFCEAVLLWDCLYVRLSFFEVVFLWGCPSVRLSFCEIVCMWGCLSARLSFCKVVFL